ncbi:MAG: prepilin-type N-terminal cleavage/methylation domain-containing protein [Ketobacter sp.]|nr:prepilin-type N-terminal cleavage/methylation domain-containing protein [Ketobacter sp.]
MKNGFTIIELMLTILILSVTLSLGVPSFVNTVKNNRITSQANALIGAISFARSESVKLNDQDVTLCGSSDQSTCNTSQLELGWILFADADSNGTRNGSEVILRIGEPLAGGNTLRLRGFGSTSLISFDSRGSLSSSGTFTLCDDRGAEEAKAIVVNISGQTRPARDDDNPTDSIVNDHGGSNVSC